ncbi:MAG: Mur ligase family protein [Candidatus Omnitrophica bacterium]|jgi:UDP-N-acetylmuramoylalanine--D-glutamate ligase|nr:Mur ligase family protein [Candidatus Omnitrophota bacterium]
MNIDNIKRVCVVGWGKSGFSLCNLLSTLKKEVRLTELKERKCFYPSLIDKLTGNGVSFEFGGHSENFLKGCQLIILSPGVDPLSSPIVKIANSLNIPYVGEVEFAYWLTKAKFVAITGTNGKTTTTFLTYRVLRENKKRVFLGGNIGIPVSSFILDTKKGDLIVLEISSFQLETILEFKPFVSALLNIEPNHLDRYPTFGDYFRAKMNIFKNQQQNDFAVLNKNIEMLSDIEKNLKSKIIYFSSEFENQNFSCIYRIATIFGLGKADCLHVFNNFKGIPHRLQIVRVINGVSFVNDSKSTNPSSTIWAFNNIKGDIILIAGGKDKGVDYKSIIPHISKVKKVNLFGQAAPKIEKALAGHIKTQIFPSLDDVVYASFKESSPKDTVLFSPMCSSFDMFKNYMERGRKFIEVVKSL